MENKDMGTEATRRMMRRALASFGGSEPRLRLVQEELAMLSKAYYESSTYLACRYCCVNLVDGEKHRHDCKFEAVEARAMLRARQDGEKAPVSQREKGYACGLAYRSLPDAEKASMEWQAHAERIIESLYDTGHLKDSPNAEI